MTLSNPLESLIGYRLRRASVDAMNDLTRDLSAIGLRPTQASALVLIASNNGMTQSEVGRILGIKRANMAPLAAVLDKLGLISRSRMDGRSHSLIASQTGTKLAAQAHEIMQRHDQLLVAQLPDFARTGLIESLEIIVLAARGPV